MDPKNFIKSPGTYTPQTNRNGMFKEFDATELYCPRCRQSNPVRKRLLLVLPDGDKYEYLCALCNESVGAKTDRHSEQMKLIL